MLVGDLSPTNLGEEKGKIHCIYFGGREYIVKSIQNRGNTHRNPHSSLGENDPKGPVDNCAQGGFTDPYASTQEHIPNRCLVLAADS